MKATRKVPLFNLWIQTDPLSDIRLTDRPTPRRYFKSGISNLRFEMEDPIHQGLQYKLVISHPNAKMNNRKV